MSEFDAAINAGTVLRNLIKQNYPSQEEFAFDFGADIRTISRYINQGINKVDMLQLLAEFFDIDISQFFIPVERNED